MRPDTLEEAMLDMMAMMAEPLDPELERAKCQTTLGTAIKHPLVYQVVGIVPGLANMALRKKKQYLKEAEDEENWYQCIFLHERPYRTSALIKYAVGTNEYGLPMPLDECEDWQRELAADVWADSENLEQYGLEWNCMLEGEGLVLCNDPEGFEALPETLVIYRGDCEDGGWSWSLDVDIARFFAQRGVGQGGTAYPLITGTCRKADVKGYLTSRGESEVIVAEGLVENQRRVR